MRPLIPLVRAKVFPLQATILKLLADQALVIPPKHTKVDNSDRVSRLGARREFVLRVWARVNGELHETDVLEHRVLAWLGAAKEVDRDDAHIADEPSQGLVALVPFLSGSSYDAKVCGAW